jgi:hypothetical protein
VLCDVFGAISFPTMHLPMSAQKQLKIPSFKKDHCSFVGQKITHHFWNLKVYCCVHNSPS